MKNRIISLMLALSLVISMTAFASDDSIIISSGILDSSYSAYDSNEEVTRGIFAQAVAELLNLKDSLVDYCDKYSDVSEQTPGCREILTLSEMKFLSGYSDGTFRPDKKVLYSEVAKVIVNILGYEYKAKSYGGYPSGYMMVANELKLLNGVSGAFSSTVTFGALMKVFENSINAPVAEINGVDDEGNYIYKTDYENTLGFKYHNIIKGKGVITATPYAALEGYFKANDECINIDGTNLYISDYSLYEKIGMQVEYIYNKEEDTDKKILLFAKETDNNKVITIDIDNYTNFINNTIYYTESDGTNKTLRIDPLSDVIVNGENKGISKELLSSVKMGSITHVSSVNGGNDVVIIKSFIDMIVGKIDEYNKKIYSEDGLSVIDLSSNSKKIRVFDSKGNSVNFNFIASGDVLTVMDSTNCCEIYVSAETVTGIISEILTENDGSYVVIGETPVKLSPDMESKIYQYKPGQNIRLSLNKFGMAAKLKLLSADGYEFLYMIKVGAVNSGSPNESVVAKFFGSEKGVVTYPMSTNVKIGDDYIKEVTAQKVELLFGGEIDRLVGIKLSENGEITDILPAKELAELEAEGKDGFVRTHKVAERHLYENPIRFDLAIQLTSATPVMVIPDNVSLAEDDDFYMTTVSALPIGKSLKTEAYNTTVEYGIPDFVIYRPESGTAAAPALVYESPLVIVKQITKVLTEDGAPATKYTVQKGTREEFFYFDGSVVSDTTGETLTAYSVTDLGVGDIIRYSSDNDNYIRILEVYFDASKNDWMYKTDTISRGRGFIKDNVAKLVGEYLYVPAWKGHSTEDLYAGVSLNEKTLSIGGISVLTLRAGKDPIVSPGTTADIRKLDNVILHIAYGQLIGIIVIK